MIEPEYTKFFKHVLYAVAKRERTLRAKGALDKQIGEIRKLAQGISEDQFHALVEKIDALVESEKHLKRSEHHDMLKQRLDTIEEKVHHLQRKHARKTVKKKVRDEEKIEQLRKKIKHMNALYQQLLKDKDVTPEQIKGFQKRIEKVKEALKEEL